MSQDMNYLEINGNLFEVVDGEARERIGTLEDLPTTDKDNLVNAITEVVEGAAVKIIESNSDAPVILRNIETGLYVLKGFFTPYAGATSSISFSNKMLTNISNTSSKTALQVFYPSTNYVRHMVITDSEFTQTYVYFDKLSESIGKLTDLQTTVKTDLVSAINEVNEKAGQGGGGGSSVTIDPTLSIEGAAADAKAVGEALDARAPYIVNDVAGEVLHIQYAAKKPPVEFTVAGKTEQVGGFDQCVEEGTVLLFGGKNHMVPISGNATRSGVTATFNAADQTVVINGTTTTASAVSVAVDGLSIPISANTDYAWSVHPVSGSMTGDKAVLSIRGGSSGTWLKAPLDGSVGAESVKSSGSFTSITRIWVYLPAASAAGAYTFDNYTIKYQFEPNTTPTGYEPYIEPTTITIPCDLNEGDVWTPATGQVVRQGGSAETYNPVELTFPDGSETDMFVEQNATALCANLSMIYRIDTQKYIDGQVVDIEAQVNAFTVPPVGLFYKAKPAAYFLVAEDRNIYVKGGDVALVYGPDSRFVMYPRDTLIAAMPTSGIYKCLSFNRSTERFEFTTNTSGTLVGFVNGSGEFYPNGDVSVKYWAESGTTTKQYASAETSAKFDELDNYNSRMTQMPVFVETAAKAAYDRFRTWAGSEDVFLLGQITDTHIGDTKYAHIAYLSEIGETFMADVLMHSGDIALPVKAQTDDNGDVVIGDDGNPVNLENCKDDAALTRETRDILFDSRRAMRGDIPWLFTKGNHDSGSYGVALAELGNIFNRPTARAHQGMTFGDDTGLYGYMDFADKKVRVYFLNTSENTSYGGKTFTIDQCMWLAESLKDEKLKEVDGNGKGWRVIVGCHICPNDRLSYSATTPMSSMSVFNAFQSRGSVELTPTSGNPVTYNYGDSTAKIAFVLCGHEHFNAFESNETSENSEIYVNYIVRQGYGGMSADVVPGMASNPDKVNVTHTAFNWKSNLLLDMIAIKSDGTGKVFRIGVDDTVADVDFTF